MNENTATKDAATPTILIQCRIAAAKKKRFWRAATNAFLAIHFVTLLVVGLIGGNQWLFLLAASSVVVLPCLLWLEYAATKPSAEARA